MSWGKFRVNMLRYMANQKGIATSDAFAKKITTEYDMTIRTGFQTINLCSIQKGNTELMETLIALTLFRASAQTSGLFPLIKELGNAVKGYWSGATLNPFPIPVIPAPGAAQNIAVTQNLCINPGEWPFEFQTPPTMKSAFLIELFILSCKIHLLSLKGMIYTTSLYPAGPSLAPGPGIISWSSYIIPAGIPLIAGKDGEDESIESDWQNLGETPPNTAGGASADIKEFEEGAKYNAGDVIEFEGNYYIGQNPEKDGERCWNIPF